MLLLRRKTSNWGLRRQEQQRTFGKALGVAEQPCHHEGKVHHFGMVPALPSVRTCIGVSATDSPSNDYIWNYWGSRQTSCSWLVRVDNLQQRGAAEAGDVKFAVEQRMEAAVMLLQEVRNWPGGQGVVWL